MLRAQAEEARKEALSEHEAMPADDLPVAQANAVMDAALSEHLAGEQVERRDSEQVVGDAIGEAIARASERVQAAAMTREQRLAKALAVELKAQSKPHTDDDGIDRIFVPEERAELPNDDENREVGWYTDEAGDAWFWDGTDWSEAA